MIKPFNILMAEEDKNLAMITKNFLFSRGYSTTVCCNGEEALQCFRKEKVDFLLINVAVPIVNGFEIVSEIRSQNTEVPVIFIGADVSQTDIIRGFQVGADDFILLPFSMEELNLRIEAIRKRARAREKNHYVFKIGGYTFDTLHHVLIYKGKEKRLTTKELDLLYLFCESMNRVVERSTALRRVWKEENYFNARNMDVYIVRLRNMLCEDPDVQLENVHGIGYRLVVHNTA